MGFPRQEYWSRLPFSSPGGSSQSRDQKPVSPALAGGFFTTEPPGKPVFHFLALHEVQGKFLVLFYTLTHVQLSIQAELSQITEASG